ncbi:MAG: hypothetical protein ACKN9W_04445 [Methylococcus sp.]
MLAIRRIIDDPEDNIPIPPEFRHRRTEVIFIALDQEPEAPASGVDVPGDPIKAFRGKGRGGSVAALLRDRSIENAENPDAPPS